MLTTTDKQLKQHLNHQQLTDECEARKANIAKDKTEMNELKAKMDNRNSVAAMRSTTTTTTTTETTSGSPTNYHSNTLMEVAGG